MPPAPPTGRSLVPLSAVSSSGTAPPRSNLNYPIYSQGALTRTLGLVVTAMQRGTSMEMSGLGSSCSVWKARLLVAAGVKPRPPPIAPCIVTLHRVTTVTCHVVSQSTVDLSKKKHHHTQSSSQDRMHCHSTRGHKCHKSRNVTKHGQFVTKAPSYPKPSPKQLAISL